MGIVAMPKGTIYGHKESAPLKDIDTRGESMNNWENIKVINREGYSAFYSEEFDLATSVGLHCFPIDKDGNRLHDVYANYNPNTRKISEDLYRVYEYSIETLFDVYEYSIETLFDLKFYRYKPEAPRNYYYGGMPNLIRLDSAEEISDIRYEVVVDYQTVGLLRKAKKKQALYLKKKTYKI